MTSVLAAPKLLFTVVITLCLLNFVIPDFWYNLVLVIQNMNVENYVLTILHDTTVTGVPSDACKVASSHVWKTAKPGNVA